ncbi:hypothetical protein [Desulfolutivibrio sp.]|uniref:hypothetical protein n=1 Tax=Desulfolutivibrio sp. TaxID=2773296 RepID=UPI002F965933
MASKYEKSNDCTEINITTGKFVFNNFGQPLIFLIIAALVYTTNSSPIDLKSLHEIATTGTTSSESTLYIHGKLTEHDPTFHDILSSLGNVRKTINSAANNSSLTTIQKSNLKIQSEAIDTSIENFLITILGKDIATSWRSCIVDKTKNEKCACENLSISKESCDKLQSIVFDLGGKNED